MPILYTEIQETLFSIREYLQKINAMIEKSKTIQNNYKQIYIENLLNAKQIIIPIISFAEDFCKLISYTQYHKNIFDKLTIALLNLDSLSPLINENFYRLKNNINSFSESENVCEISEMITYFEKVFINENNEYIL